MYNKSLSHYLCFLLALSITILSGCEEKNYITNHMVDNSLTDPNVQPRVVFTNPANGAVGPFSNYDLYDPPIPKFTIQLNKLVNVSDIRSDAITLKVDGVNYYVRPYDYTPLQNILYYSAPYDMYLANKIYTVTVDTTLTDIHGNRLSAPYVFSFIPEPEFRVYFGYPTDDEVSPIWLSYISVYFNSKLDSSIFEKISISPSIEGEWTFTDNYYYYTDSTSTRYLADDTLLYDTEYTVSVAADARDANGLLINEPYQFSFTTEPFEVSSVGYSSHTGPGGFYVYNNFRFEFNGFVDTSTVKPAFAVTPPLPYAITFDYAGYGKYDGFKVVFDETQMQPNTTYKMTLGTTVRSIDGTYMKNPYSYNFKTGSL